MQYDRDEECAAEDREVQRTINRLRAEFLDGREKRLDNWMKLIAVTFGLITIIFAFFGYRLYEQTSVLYSQTSEIYREMMKKNEQADDIIEELEKTLGEAKFTVEELGRFVEKPSREIDFSTLQSKP